MQRDHASSLYCFPFSLQNDTWRMPSCWLTPALRYVGREVAWGALQEMGLVVTGYWDVGMYTMSTVSRGFSMRLPLRAKHVDGLL